MQHIIFSQLLGNGRRHKTHNYWRAVQITRTMSLNKHMPRTERGAIGNMRPNFIKETNRRQCQFCLDFFASHFRSWNLSSIMFENVPFCVLFIAQDESRCQNFHDFSSGKSLSELELFYLTEAIFIRVGWITSNSTY